MKEVKEIDPWADIEEAWRRQDHLAGATAGGRRQTCSTTRGDTKAGKRGAGRNCQGTKKEVAPRHVTVSSLSLTKVTPRSRRGMVVAEHPLSAPGGRKIVSVVPQILSNMIDAGDSAQAALQAPRLRTEGSDLWVDDRVGCARIAAPEKRGHPVVPRTVTFSSFFFARPMAIRISRQDWRWAWIRGATPAPPGSDRSVLAKSPRAGRVAHKKGNSRQP
jgi:hypothetical protein